MSFEESQHNKPPVSGWDRALAGVCMNCPACRQARKHQAGAAFWLVSRVETHVCPFCRAYERVYGRKSHLPLSPPVA